MRGLHLVPILLALTTGCHCCCCRREHQDERRAGHPSLVSPLAQPSETKGEIGYEVGGGAVPCRGKGEERCAEEGTWGWDYEGHLLPAKINLGWWHGARQQGGSGAYRTDGPRPIQAWEQKKE
jgi:hypothetical protein